MYPYIYIYIYVNTQIYKHTHTHIYMYIYIVLDKKNSEKTEPFFINVTNFNETSMTKIHDHFPWLLLSKFP